jgi:hypothetical protein
MVLWQTPAFIIMLCQMRKGFLKENITACLWHSKNCIKICMTPCRWFDIGSAFFFALMGSLYIMTVSCKVSGNTWALLESLDIVVSCRVTEFHACSEFQCTSSVGGAAAAGGPPAAAPPHTHTEFVYMSCPEPRLCNCASACYPVSVELHVLACDYRWQRVARCSMCRAACGCCSLIYIDWHANVDWSHLMLGLLIGRIFPSSSLSNFTTINQQEQEEFLEGRKRSELVC